MGKWRTFRVTRGWPSSSAVAAISRSASASPGWLRRYRRPSSPARRAPGQPAELAPNYVFLASQESSNITGEVVGVTGGRPLS